MTVRIAMWSGPRNISTAMMRAWENRADCEVVDEPFYAHYLIETGLDHPGRDEIIASQANDWREVAANLIAAVPGGPAICYQKHMAHHLLTGMEGHWLESLTHAFLIRSPAEMIASYSRRRRVAGPDELGLHRQVEIWRLVHERTGRAPPVIDSRDVLENPEGMLKSLCAAFGVTFDAAMLSWPAGPRASDGVWAPHWYASVEESTGFKRYQPKAISLDEQEQEIARLCAMPYEFLRERRLTASAA